MFIGLQPSKAELINVVKRLYLYGGLPFVSGPLMIKLGTDCRISGQPQFSGCGIQPTPDGSQPLLSIGNNVDVGWQSTIAVGQKVVLSDNVRTCRRCLSVCLYLGHLFDAKRRAAGEGDDQEQIGSIILEKDVWLARNRYGKRRGHHW